MTDQIIQDLAETIRARRLAPHETSYTRQLLDAGPSRCARKLGEEATETIIAGICEDAGQLQTEAADLLYHLLVLLESRNVEISDVLAILQQRMGTSGLTEKESRT
ncbi:MAG: phosphoribosyl-ATP diphosphatase [Hyphomicrobiaceae bacterium]